MIKTRFAPSPTGFLHIGGVRTALFNWLYARQNGGHFVLRIDDTDAGRQVNEAIQPIIDGFKWLGLDIDEGPVFQSSRRSRYDEVISFLYQRGFVYRDYSTPEHREQLQREHDAKGTKKPYRFRGGELPPGQVGIYDVQKRPYVMRFKVTPGRLLTLQDKIRGEVKVNTDEIPDFVVSRADGSPLYNLATAIDDHDMEITHVIRAEEHLSNTFPQMLIMEALGWKSPTYAHIPFVTAPPKCKEKLSKRHAALLGIPVGLHEFREMGYLPEAMINYLARLGWSLDDHTEYFSLKDLIRDFSLEGIVNSPACYNQDKLFSVQSHWMGVKPMEEKKALALIQLIENPGMKLRWSTQKKDMDHVGRVIAALGDRLKFPADLLKYGKPFLQDDEDMEFDEAAFDKRITNFPQGYAILSSFRDIFSRLQNHPEDAPEDGFQGLCARMAELRGIKPGDVNHALRLAITGQPVGPGVYDAVDLLGYGSCLARVDRAIRRCNERKLKQKHEATLELLNGNQQTAVEAVEDRLP